MQNYGQQAGYQRPGSTTGFAGQQQGAPPPPPAYGGYQSGVQNQWPNPAQNQASNQQWNQPQQQVAGGYNPNTYGVMPGGQQHDQPPPPPPKPYGFAGAVQQQQQHQQQHQNQGWPSQQQQGTGNAPQQQGGYPVQGGGQNQSQPYNNAAPPPPSATPGGSYFPPTQGGRPGSIYGAPSSSQPPSGPQQASTVVSPNEQQPAYIPPSLTGQGVQAYMPSNTNPMPGVYVPPPPDIPAWQQAQHAPLQGGNKKFTYTKPSVDPSFYAQGYQGVQQQPLPPAPPPKPHEQYVQSPAQSHQPQNAYGQQQQQPQQFTQQGQIGQQQPPQPPPLPPQYHHPPPPQGRFGAANTSKPSAYDHNVVSTPPNGPVPPGPPQMASNMSKPAHHEQIQPQWPSNVPAGQGAQQGQQRIQSPYGMQQQQQQQWQPGHHQAQSSLGGGQYAYGSNQNIEAPRPLGRSDTASSNFFNQPSPQSQPVSPVNNRQSMSFGSNSQTGVGRNSSVSSIALANLHAQREGAGTSSPRPAPPKLPTPPPPRDDKSKFSALGSGGPSDWEHFGADAEIDDEEMFAKKKNEPVQLDSVELPASQPQVSAGPSPPSTHGCPSPVTQPATIAPNTRQDTYQPTPPPTIAQLAQQPSSETSQQGVIMGDAVPAPLRLSPKSHGGSRPSSTQQSFTIGEGGWQAPKESTPVQQQPQHKPPPTSQSFVMDDGGWAAQSAPVQQERQATPQQQVHQPPQVNTTGFVVDNGGWNGGQQTPTQEASSWRAQPPSDQSAELKAKDEAFERLRIDSEKDKIALESQIEKLKADIEMASTQIADEKTMLHEQIEAMRGNAEQARNHSDTQLKEKVILLEEKDSLLKEKDMLLKEKETLLKERDVTIERLKEDVEGKDHNIEERDATIADLRQQLEAEKSKEIPTPTPVPADLLPGIDAWYASSLQRYITMLRGEANEPEVGDKIKTFKAFLKAESAIRGIDYFDAPHPSTIQNSVPTAPVQDTTAGASNPVPVQADLNRITASNVDISSSTSKSIEPRKGLNVQVPPTAHEDDEDDDFEYSPGGRPVLKRKPTLPSTDNASTQRRSNMSAQSTTILTPTSSVDDDTNKTPVQSPSDDKPQPQYKAYVPPAAVPPAPVTTGSAPLAHRQSMSFVAPAGAVIQPTAKKHDEIFFGAHEPDVPKPLSRPDSVNSSTPDVPAPLSFASSRAASTAPPTKRSPSDELSALLPVQIAPSSPNKFVEGIRAKLASLNIDSDNMDVLTSNWDKSASLKRKQNDEARRKRQEEQEEINDEAFNNNEISYADLNVLEEELKEKEGALKAQEDRDEYRSYVEAVFDRVYDDLQNDIKALMDLYVEGESLLHTSVSGIRSLEGGDAPNTQQCLELLRDLHKRILNKQEKVVQAVAERDKRYKKTEIQPLYAAGNMAKMRVVKEHFDNAEKQAILRAMRDKAGRVGELVSLAEEIVVNAVGVEQHEIDNIITAIRHLDENLEDTPLLSRAHETLSCLKSSSKSLLSLLNSMELDLNAAVSDAELAQAKAENADATQIQQLEAKKKAEENKLKEEFERKVSVLEQDKDEIDALVREKGGKVVLSEEEAKERRLEAALEAAKKRNGHA